MITYFCQTNILTYFICDHLQNDALAHQQTDMCVREDKELPEKMEKAPTHGHSCRRE